MEHPNMEQESQEEESLSKSHPGPATPADLLSGTQLISFGDRITYVFSHGKEVGSVHFDRGRGEIFYKGHNIRNMELEDWQLEIVSDLKPILSADPQGKHFSNAYGKTLEKILLEKKR